MTMLNRITLLFSVLPFSFFLLPSFLFSQDEFYHPEQEWQTIETAHFKVHFHTGAERTARVVSKLAEEIYDPVTSLYNHKPDQKVSFIIKDFEDISNGAAYFYDNKVEIWAPSMDFDLRGTHNWLRNVVTHEFTHIVQIQTTFKFGRTIPGIYLQWLGYESERRPDVLYGFPNIIASYPLSGFVVPVWFAEGVAQYNRGELRYDFWDTHRDMILRSYALDSNMLTWEQMGVFGKTSLGNESSYNAGFAFVSYVAKKYGDKKLNEISRNLSRPGAATIDGAIEDALGKTGADVYNEWRDEVRRDYAARVAPIRGHIREGERIPLLNEDGEQETGSFDVASPSPTGHGHGAGPARGISLQCCKAAFHTGFANLHPAYSPDGKKIAYLTTKAGDYFGQSALYLYDTETQKEERLQAGVRTGIAWSPDGKTLYYGKASRKNPFWSLLFDLYAYDIEKEEETRLTHGKRAMSPSVSPDGKHIAFATGADGTSNIAMVNSDGSGYRQVTSYMNGEQVYSPRWSPAGDRILFDYSIKDGRDLAWVKPDGSEVQFLVTGEDDARSGVFTPDGSRIVFSSDRTGIFNLYRYEIRTGAVEQLTNVLGGAFMPSMSPSGDIVYASYTSAGYKILRLRDSTVVGTGDHQYRKTEGEPVAPAISGGTNGEPQEFDWHRLRSYDDTQLPPLSARPYRNVFTSLAVVPFLRVDNYNTSDDALDALKPGVYLFSQDVLDKVSMFASIALNKKLERDLYLQFAYRGKVPLFFQLGLEPVLAAELYNITRSTDNFIELPEATIPVEVSYNLLEFDFVMTQPFLSQFSNVEFRFAHSRYTSIIEAFFNPIGGQLIPGSSDLYLVANDLSLKFTLNGIPQTRTSEINPVGGKLTLRIGRELNKFNGDGDYTVGSTGLIPLYKYINFTRAEVRGRVHFPALLKDHTISVSFRGGSILEHSVDDFFDFYAGGLLGMKGYPFYALGGNELAVAGLEYRFPLVHNIDVRFLHLYFDKLYASVYADIGNAWTGTVPNLRQFKTDMGAELRLESFSWYAYPTRIFFNAAYGFDQFDRFIPSRNTTVTYGKEWRFYLGVLFGFDLD